MRNILTLFFVMLSTALCAQSPVKLYDEMCDPLQAVFCDYVRNESSQNFLSSGSGQYTGTVIDGKIYGWGFILAADGTRSFGQFRNGKNIFGISITDKIAKVGGDSHYVIYDLATGGIIRLSSKEGNARLVYPLVPDEENPVSPYSFKKETYANGDVYIGEFYNGKRHGYGIYYYPNGNRYEGNWASGERHGQGTMYYANGTVQSGTWDNGKFVK